MVTMFRTRKQLRADNELLLWLHEELAHTNRVQQSRLGEARTLAAAKKAEAQIARDLLEKVENSERKWRTIAQTVVESERAASVPGGGPVVIDGHGAWSRGALAVVLDEFERCRDITRRVAAARDSVKRFIRDSHQLGVCHPIAESLARSLEEILDDATTPAPKEGHRP